MASSHTCPACGLGQFIRIEKNNDINRKIYSCGHREIIGIKNETVNVSENNTTVLTMTFDLYDSVKIGGSISNSGNIEFIIDPANHDSIKQFKIKLINPSLEDEKKALQKASEITNYLSIMANRSIKHKHPLTQRIVDGKMTNTVIFTTDCLIHENFDLDANFLDYKLLNKNADLSKRLQLYKDGLKDLENNDFAGAIQSFHQCIEKTGLSEEKQYKPLRNAASHIIIYPWVVTKLKSMGIKIALFNSLNENDPDNQRILKENAKSLQQVAFNHLKALLMNL